MAVAAQAGCEACSKEAIAVPGIDFKRSLAFFVPSVFSVSSVLKTSNPQHRARGEHREHREEFTEDDSSAWSARGESSISVLPRKI